MEVYVIECIKRRCTALTPVCWVLCNACFLEGAGWTYPRYILKQGKEAWNDFFDEKNRNSKACETQVKAEEEKIRTFISCNWPINLHRMISYMNIVHSAWKYKCQQQRLETINIWISDNWKSKFIYAQSFVGRSGNVFKGLSVLRFNNDIYIPLFIHLDLEATRSLHSVVRADEVFHHRLGR